MKCPLHRVLKYNIRVDKNGEYEPEYCTCREKECAWWDTNKKQCCIKTLSELKGKVDAHLY